LETHTVYDAIVIGAGGAGLNLLLAMHKQGYLNNHKVLVIEPVRNVTNNRTWCFWAKPNENIVKELGHLIPQVWDYSETEGKKSALHPYRYYHLRGIDFYNYVYKIIDNHPNITWQTDAVNTVQIKNNTVEITASSQKLFVGKFVFDSRIDKAGSIQLSKPKDNVWQSFFGYHIKIKNESFQPDAVRLMDFSVEQNKQCQFIYLLPFSSNQALIELTRFGSECLNSTTDNDLLEKWIHSRFGEFEIIEKEEGIIPMTLAFNPKREFHHEHERIIPIGTAGGNVKGTTGYAFYSMFNHSWKIATSLVENKPFPTAFHKARLSFYDTLLLDILKNKPHLGKDIFSSLFKAQPSPNVLTFLREETSLKDEIPILWSLPKKPFISALFKYIFSFSTNTKKGISSFKIEFIALILTLFFVVISLFNSSMLAHISPLILLAGMIFPGIPHGALDHKIRLSKKFNLKKFGLFVALYITIMLLILALWAINTSLALSVFILYSAWHFGETDFNRYNLKSSLGSFLSGLSLLIFILFSHYQEFKYYLNYFDTQSLLIPNQSAVYISVVAIVLFIVNGFIYLDKAFRTQLILITAILLLSIKLPLLLAFGIYFLLIHSFSGWMDIHKGLNINHIELLKQSAPLTVGAIITLSIIAFAYANSNWSLGNLVPALFIGLSCLSAPHVMVMSEFYRRAQNR
jgi:lycopene beta-cyclase